MTNEEAKKILDSSFVWQKMVEEECEALGMAIKALEEPKTGKWIQDGRVDDDGNIYFYCSNCKRGDTHAKGQKVPFCWWCGARMEAESEDKE